MVRGGGTAPRALSARDVDLGVFLLSAPRLAWRLARFLALLSACMDL